MERKLLTKIGISKDLSQAYCQRQLAKLAS